MEYIEEFQKLLIAYDIDAYVIPTSDYHNSEYISDYFKGRQLLSGFTGSAGTLVVTKTRGYLWVDGRYFIQAEREIDHNRIELMKIGMPDTPTIGEFLGDFFKDVTRKTLAFDAKVMNTAFVNEIKKYLSDEILIHSNSDLLNEIWLERPKLPFSVLYKLDDQFTGRPFEEKLVDVRFEMKKNSADILVISQLEDQAWLYNLRGNDITHTPVFLSYTVITKNQVILFIDENKIDLTVSKYLDENNITVRGYNEIYTYVSNLSSKRIMLDLKRVNYQLYLSCDIGNDIIECDNPTLLLKSVKNDIEIANIKEAHIKDGVAMVKFMCLLKKGFEAGWNLTEISLSNKLQELREKDKGLIDLSFNTICAFKDHGAMMHYSANKDTNYKVEGSGFLLVDSGGHYLEGTTDVTRTFALGKITDEMKVNFTTVLKSVIALSTVTFLEGCSGQNLDVLARRPIWDRLIDYKCGTGHGVGYVLSVHEGPNAFRWQTPTAIIKPGMITTNEPGIYLKDKYGIRIENEILAIEKAKNEWGNFLQFETITYVPIDIDAIKPTLLSKEEKEWINNYHKMVYDKLSPHLEGEELDFLKDYTKKI